MCGSSCQSPCRARVVTHQTGPHHRSVRVDNPAASRPYRAIVGLGVSDLFIAVQNARPAAHPCLGQARRPQAGLAHRAAIRGHLDLTVEPKLRDRIEIDSRSAFHDHFTAAIGLEKMIKSRLIIAWVEAPTSGTAPRRVGQHHRVAGYRVQRVGAAQVGRVTEIVPRHRQPYRVEVAPDRAGGRAIRRRQLGADRARYIVNHFAAQPFRAMQRYRCSAGLLQRLVGEQPVAGAGQLGELGDRAASQQHRLHQQRCPVAEFLS